MEYINETGLQEIRDFLSINHKKGDNFTDAQIQAWAADAEFQMAEGNPRALKLKAGIPFLVVLRHAQSVMTGLNMP